MPETKTPQKFPRCEKCGTTLEPSELVNGYFCPNEKCDRGAIAEEKPSLHPTDDEIIELNDEIYTANLDDQDKTAILLYRTAFEAGQKSERQRIFAEVDKILLDVDIDENLWEKLKTELSK